MFAYAALATRNAEFHENRVFHPEAIAAMRDIGIDISGYRSKHVDEFRERRFDFVITVCDNARETCPVFFDAAQRLHHDFDDPAASRGSEAERLVVFRRVRDELRQYLREFVKRVVVRAAP